MTVLHVFASLPGTDRKNKAYEYAEKNEMIYISADNMREDLKGTDAELDNSKLFDEMYKVLKKELKKQDVVFDATNLYSKQRKHLLQMVKPDQAIIHYILTSLETAILGDSKNEVSLGKEFVTQKYLTAEIPFVDEGWDYVEYWVEEIAGSQLQPYVKERDMLLTNDTEETVVWAHIFLPSGKEILNRLPEGLFKRVGYNNMSAQIAFQSLYNLNYPISFIQEVVQLILYAGRLRKAHEQKGKDKLREQIGEELFQKVLLLTQK